MFGFVHVEEAVLSGVSQTQLLPRSRSQTIVEVGHQSAQNYNFNQTQRDGGVQLIIGCLTYQQDNRLDLALMVGVPGGDRLKRHSNI